ncbi:FimV/HubP family polar landmark protein [Moraxella nonliquefaciens]|uniref:FimV/HubP family polar landmark protein n=1 Tax=Moraxella nonliquefaciens TaxID=478 RepID=UPI00081F0B52|nr:FimV/HubP family polar landmark protein [Moraxella nonliquefaciens]OBX49035.1 hypothetical protein A9Z65_01700 [Moraxella nonliquefaciens]
MQTMIIAIGAVVVIGIVAFFVLKKLQAQKLQLPTNPQPHLPTQQDSVTPVAPTPNTADELAAADAHIRNQNYQEAMAELKRVLMTNPRHNGALLKLLQTYGITKQFAAFNQLHQKIHEIGDDETIREADFCKSLLEEEMAKTTALASNPQSTFEYLDFDLADEPKPTAKVEPTDDLDSAFELETPQPPKSPTKPSADSNDFDLNFDVSPQKMQSTTTPALEEPALGFDDLSFDEPSGMPSTNESTLDFDDQDPDTNLDTHSDNILNNEPNNNPNSDELDELDELDALDFNFDTPSPASTSSTSPVSSEELDFDFDLTDEPKPTAKVEPTDDLALDGIDFDINQPSTSAQPATPSQADVSDFGDFDLSFDVQPTPQANADDRLDFDGLDADFDLTDEPKPTAKVEPESVAPSTDFADFDLELDGTPTPEQISDDANDSLEFDGLDLGLDTPSTQSTASKSVAPKQDTTMAFDANELAFDTMPTTEISDLDFGDLDFAETPAATTPTATSEDASSDLAEPNRPTPKPEPSTQPTTTASSAPESTQTTRVLSELSFVDSLDNTEVTFNLAKQYLDLGEYDSAKRLLDEVIQTGSTTQQQNARELLTQLA